MRLRPYQERAVVGVFDAWRTSKSVLVVAPTGAGKCVSRSTFVWSGGLKRFGDAWGATRIASPHGAAEVTGWYDDGERDGYKVTLECGLSVDGTPAHRVWVRSNDGFEGWRPIGELGATDYVALARGEADFGETSIPADEAYALGLLIADGCLVGKAMQIDKQRPVLERVRAVLERWCSMMGARTTVRIKDKSPRHAVLHCHAPFQAFLWDRYGVRWDYSKGREVPANVLHGTRDVVRSFLSGYFDGDGYCDRCPAVSTASSVLADQVMHLLLGLGVYAGRRTKKTPRLPAHIVEIRDVVAFAREVGFTDYGLTKDRAFARLLIKPRNTNVDVVPGVGQLLRKAAHLVPWHTTRWDAWRHVDAYYASRRPSYPMLAEFASGLPECPERLELIRILGQHRAWSRVQSVERSACHRIDCEVPGPNAFVGNGIINHNTVIGASIAARSMNGEAAACVSVPANLVARGGRASSPLVISAPQTALWIAHRRELVHQAAEKLRVFLGAANVGAICPGISPTPDAPMQVATIQTLLARGERPPARLIVLDEAPHYAADDWQTLLDAYPDAKTLGLTATPERADGRPLGDIFEELVVAANYSELLRDGHLVGCRVIQPPLPQEKGTLSEDPVEAYQKYADGSRAFLFADSVPEAHRLRARFCALGIPAATIEAATPKDERAQALSDFARGDVRVLTNVYALTEGVDVPAAQTCILARASGHVSPYLQMVGRVLRPHAEKPYAVLVDLSGATLRHGLPTEDRVYSLEGRGISRVDDDDELPTCPGCDSPRPRGQTCVACGFVPSRYPAPTPKVLKQIMREVYSGMGSTDIERVAEYRRLREIQASRGYRIGWVVKSYEKRFDEAPSLGDVSIEERHAEYSELAREGQERGYKPGYPAARYRHLFGGWPPWEWRAA